MSRYNLLIDCSFINDYKYWPVSIALYTGRLFQGLSKRDTFKLSAIVWKGKEDYIDYLAGYEVDKIVVDEHTKITPWRALDRILGLNPLIKEVKKRHIDIVLSPYHFECYFFFPKRFRHYAIVQDMIPYYILEYRIGKLKFKLWKVYRRLLNRKITSFISISENTRKDFMQFEGRDSLVVYNSIPFDFTVNEEIIPEVSDKKYILDINRFEVHKNAEVLIRAFYLIHKEIPHLLYLKGDERNAKYRQHLEGIVAELGLMKRVIIDKSNRSEGQIRYLYSHASLAVSPSLMEGFGWTPIEAAILKTNVIASNIEVFKEITCDKIKLFNPRSPEELAGLMIKTLANPLSIEEKDDMSKFYMEKYSLESQIKNLTNVLLDGMN